MDKSPEMQTRDAVSYTHLDVYKRQDILISNERITLLNNCIKFDQNTFRYTMMCLDDCYGCYGDVEKRFVDKSIRHNGIGRTRSHCCSLRKCYNYGPAAQLYCNKHILQAHRGKKFVSTHAKVFYDFGFGKVQ